MRRIFIVAEDAEQAKELNSGLTQTGFDCLVASDTNNMLHQITGQSFDLALVDVGDSPGSAQAGSVWAQLREIKRQLPVIAIVSKEVLDAAELDVDDFMVKPGNLSELAVRIRRVFNRSNNADGEELIRCGDLLIDLAKCEVSIGGKLLALTFKEYELLRFLATNKGRVFSRDALLNEVWGYDYYGGDRTVDVHIRRLRSKIEDSTHTFVETVRNMGYKFREETKYTV